MGLLWVYHDRLLNLGVYVVIILAIVELLSSHLSALLQERFSVIRTIPVFHEAALIERDFHFHSSENSPEDVQDVSVGPQSKRMRHEEEDEDKDLGFWIVKGKDGQKQLFVDLGTVTHSFVTENCLIWE